MKLTAPRGTKDILPEDVGMWQKMERIIDEVCSSYGYLEIRTPMFEHTEVFQRGIGEATDIVEKEMYTFTDKGNRSVTLRPEGTASVVRAFLEHKMYGNTHLSKLYYVGPMFRYERPQAGRYRQFHQFGVEAIGSDSPLLDAEIIDMASTIYKRLGIDDCEIKVNSIGCPKCRNDYQEYLKETLKDSLGDLCKNCVARYNRNPMRILDCKTSNCKRVTANVKSMAQYLCQGCSLHFNEVLKCLDSLKINYSLDNRLVRGFDYYTKTVFEIVYKGLGAQDAIGGGGRYDGLVEEYGGPHMPAVGFAAGMERILLTLQSAGKLQTQPHELDVYISCLNGKASSMAFNLLSEMRHNNISSELDYFGRSLKAQMKSANKSGAQYVIILGPEEIEKNIALVKDMDSGQQNEIKIEGLIDYLLTKIS